MENTVYFKAGDKDEIAVVLSCPGRYEAEAKPPGPAKGQMGKNLDAIFKILQENNTGVTFSRQAATITNAWPEVLYREKSSGRSEATRDQVCGQKNLQRLLAELGGIKKYIICSGKNAPSAVSQLQAINALFPNVKIIKVRHLGNTAINKISYYKNGDRIAVYKSMKDIPANETRSLVQIRQDNRRLRLEVVANEIQAQL